MEVPGQLPHEHLLLLSSLDFSRWAQMAKCACGTILAAWVLGVLPKKSTRLAGAGLMSSRPNAPKSERVCQTDFKRSGHVHLSIALVVRQTRGGVDKELSSSVESVVEASDGMGKDEDLTSRNSRGIIA